MFHIEEKPVNGTFNDGIMFTIVVSIVAIIFVFSVLKMGVSFFATVANPLKKDLT